ncbi:hypothetical protein OZ410_00590 [Robiginitalea sp. M366]|nr:hypothetical protein [Robiginitalea aestuariiviva]MDG1570794.1 hypothetical protein [Robiginitalea aestuariiviva]
MVQMVLPDRKARKAPPEWMALLDPRDPKAIPELKAHKDHKE